MSADHSTKRQNVSPRWLCAALGLVAVLGACGLLLARPHGSFYGDWVNHLWKIAYHEAELRHHASLPVTFNGAPDLGMATPIFYGYLFFPVAGALSLLTGPDAAIRLLVVALFALQFALTWRACLRLGGDWRLAAVVACLVSWAIYPLTNLYNRNALPELFGVGFLTCATLLWFELLDEPSNKKLAWRFGLLVCLAVGTHPITGLFGVLFLALLFACTAGFSSAPALARSLAAPAAATAVVLSGWLYSMVRLKSQLFISQGSGRWIHYPGIDTLLARLVPYDARMVDGAK
ncbi:MAG: hypothetical protein HY075_10150, partial [Deltaproteobacteria bacterium]|nr:hypothetical protein [Deltaproteobacteria bacterium]